MLNFFKRLFNRSIQNYILSGSPYENNEGNTEDNRVADGVYVDDDDICRTNLNEKDFLANKKIIADIISFHEKNIAPKYKIKRDYYKGRHHKILEQKNKPMGKPDNRLINNLPKKLVDTFTGFFIGDPIQIKYSDGTPDEGSTDKINDEIADWCNENDVNDLFSEYAKMADIFGRAYLRAYKYDGKIKATTCSPRDTILIYKNDASNTPLIAINYSTNDNGKTGTIITKDADYLFNNKDKNFITNKSEKKVDGNELVEDEYQHSEFGILPVFELAENEERIGLFDNVIDLIDSADNVISNKNNDIDAISNAYLVIKGVELDKKARKSLRDDKLINFFDKAKTSAKDNRSGNTKKNIEPDAKFLSPQINDDMQEHMLDRLIDLIYQNSQVVNLNDNSFGMSAQSISGIALKQRYQAMQAKAKTKSNKMDKALRSLFIIVFNNLNLNADVKHLEFKHKQSIPKNTYEEAQTLSILIDHTTLETALSAYSPIDNPMKEAALIKEDDDKNGSTIQNEVNKQLSGVDSDESNSDKK